MDTYADVPPTANLCLSMFIAPETAWSCTHTRASSASSTGIGYGYSGHSLYPTVTTTHPASVEFHVISNDHNSHSTQRDHNKTSFEGAQSNDGVDRKAFYIKTYLDTSSNRNHSHSRLPRSPILHRDTKPRLAIHSPGSHLRARKS